MSDEPPELSLHDFLDENSSQFTIMGVFAAIAVYLSSIKGSIGGLESKYLNLGVISALILFFIVSLVIAHRAYLRFQSHPDSVVSVFSKDGVVFVLFFAPFYIVVYVVAAVVISHVISLVYILAFLLSVVALGIYARGIAWLTDNFGSNEAKIQSVAIVTAYSVLVLITSIITVGIVVLYTTIDPGQILQFKAYSSITDNLIAIIGTTAILLTLSTFILSSAFAIILIFMLGSPLVIFLRETPKKTLRFLK